jgi:hypothetical protein
MKIIYILFLIAIFILNSCSTPENSKTNILEPILSDFDPSTLFVKQTDIREVKGQVLYLPVYSNIPLNIDSSEFDMSAFVAVHNTDLYDDISIRNVLFFNSDGKLVYDFLKRDTIIIAPLATKDFYIPYEDKSGTGANFIVEWTSDSLVSEPLIETVTISLKPNQSVAVMSQGRVIREQK